MKMISKNFLIVMIAFLVFALVAGQLQKMDDGLLIKEQQKAVMVFNLPISTYNLGK